MIGLINMNMGNLLSVRNAFAKIGVDCTEITSPKDISDAKAVVLPGVGAFHEAMSNLGERGLVAPLQKIAREGEIPILGICLGMQLLADESEEHGVHRGLGLISGRVIRLQEQEIQSKVPNVGWCHTSFRRPSRFISDPVGSGTYYYVHSYHFTPKDNDVVIATISLGPKEVVSAVEKGSVSGVQFHPEKSQDDGLDLLARWAASVGLSSAAGRAVK